jgi:eukaryotic-like serine/threonine-protein kinase
LMVAFSVPIWSDSVEESGRTPIGTLAIGVELGDFAIGRNAVLADTRVDQFEGRRGLILHHPRLGLKSSEEALPRLSEAVLESALVLRAEHRQVSRLHAVDHSHVIEQFHDPVDGKERLAVMEPVVVLGRPTDVADTGWIVVAEEAAE